MTRTDQTQQASGDPVSDGRDRSTTEPSEKSGETAEGKPSSGFESGSHSESVHFSSRSDEHGTPLSLIKTLHAGLGGRFDLDPASGAEPVPIATTRYTEADDGLSHPWHGTVYCNPPYSDVASWLEKASIEAASDRVNAIVCLIPNRTSTEWFHSAIREVAGYFVFDDRLQFGESDTDAPFPSALLFYKKVPDGIRTALESGSQPTGEFLQVDAGDSNKRSAETAAPVQTQLPATPSEISPQKDTVRRLNRIGACDVLELSLTDVYHSGPPSVCVHVDTTRTVTDDDTTYRELLCYEPSSDHWYLLRYEVEGDSSPDDSNLCCFVDRGEGEGFTPVALTCVGLETDPVSTTNISTTGHIQAGL